MRTLYILTAPQMSGFLRGQLAFLRKAGLEPVLCVPELTEPVRQMAEAEGVPTVVVPMCRDIRPWQDLRTFVRLLRLLWQLKPEATVTIGPKAGLVGGLAAAACQVPCRVQTKWGIRLETTRGLLRAVLTLADWVAAACAHRVLCDSASGRSRTIELGLAPAWKVRVVASGSANGIDTSRFTRSAETETAARLLRQRLGAGPGQPVVGFVGRISRDKGLRELVVAWKAIQDARPGAILAVVGGDECSDPEEKALLVELAALAGVRMLGQQSGMERVFPAFDVLLLPSHREGFGVVVLEAGAMEIPTVGFAVTGMRDSVVSGRTGTLVEFGDTTGLVRAVMRYLDDAGLRLAHGQAARARVLADFRQEQVWAGYLEALGEVAAERGVPNWRLRRPTTRHG